MKTASKQFAPRSASHRALFDSELPFRARRVELKNRYNRKDKHRSRNFANQLNQD